MSPEKKAAPAMLMPTIIMGVLAAVLMVIAFRKGGDTPARSLKSSLGMMIQIFPLLVLALIVAGTARELIPGQMIAKWVGSESGIKGILIGSIAGGLAPGGPYVSMPLAAGLLRAGAGLGTMVAFITAWSLWAVARIPLEVGILGWKFTAARMLCTSLFPPLAGLIANLLFGKTI